MKIQILTQRHNDLLNRDEITIKILHEGTGTPTRVEVRKKVATILNVDIERVYIKKVETKTGSMTSVGEVNVYDTAEQAKYLEPEFIILRNLGKEKKTEET